MKKRNDTKQWLLVSIQIIEKLQEVMNSEADILGIELEAGHEFLHSMLRCFHLIVLLKSQILC